jgi:hypothetical protein
MTVKTIFINRKPYTQIDIRGRKYPLLIPKKKGKRWKFYPPTFNGKHNELKCKVLYILYEAYNNTRGGGSRWLTAKQIYELSSINYRSLLTRLPLYHRWKYILCPKRRYGFKRYAISKAGRAYFDKYRDDMPLARYKREIKELRAKNNARGH